MKNGSRSRSSDTRPLSIEQLEAGLQVLSRAADQDAFWERNVAAFRQTLLVAILETSDALSSPDVPDRWRIELELQIDALCRYVEMADRHVVGRARRSRLN